MKIVLASDHRGFYAKSRVIAYLEEKGHTIDDLGCSSLSSCDYPDHGLAAAESVADGKAERGILFCGTGIGMSIVANKVSGIRAAVCHDELTAELSFRHNQSNVLCLPADLLGEELMKRVVDAWLSAEFEGGRHERRIEKITRYESNSHDAD